ncbi:TPA: hypothetical protein O4F65_001279 [Staphylococcus aureus]|uniref:hypothetical protein n=1 Tax=Staphylococcus aureus TaxID=1280 RepID=UPI0006BA9E02|nr:hypothetical protein [Staphylococcus aureus]HCZ8192627.1 hypothetical protein [Staphylococcus aureus]HCZ8195742.1 hypothetical protein [Staphylococcus aureus]HCZ8222656.1 hypothetical protein [Staphylococcus aureus]HCZ8224755.1 hypothetical protein [Staphylococcus aureus]HCZ8227780.1 hypothetical protein [Staphylococcus aureus]
MEFKIKQVADNNHIFLGYVLDYCRASLKTLDIDKSLTISIKQLNKGESFSEYTLNGVVIYIYDEDIESIIRCSSSKVAYKLLIRRVLDSLYDALEADLNKETKMNLWNNFERSTLAFFKHKLFDSEIVTLPRMMFEYDYMNKHSMKDIESKKERIHKIELVNRVIGDVNTPAYFDFSDQTVKDVEKNEDDIIEELIKSNIQKITELELPEPIKLINSNLEDINPSKYKPESIFALNNIMHYIDKSFYEIVGADMQFQLADVKNFAANNIHSSNQESMGKGTIYNKFTPRTFNFHEFVIISAIATFYKNPYIKMMDLGKFSSLKADDLTDFIWTKIVGAIDINKQNEVASLIDNIFRLTFTPLNTKKHYNAVQTTFDITDRLTYIISNTSKYNKFINYENLINSIINSINNWIKYHNNFIQQMESDVASLNFVSDKYYLDIFEAKELDNDFNNDDDSLLNSMTSFKSLLDNLTNKVDEKLVCILITKTIKKL